MQEYFEVGQIVNTNGLKGLLKINPFTDDITRIESVRYQKKQVLLKLKGIDTIEEAEKYREDYLKINRNKEEKLPKDTYYIVDLIGLDIYTEDGELLGKLDDVFSTGSNDVYVVKNGEGKQILLPAISDVIKNIDLEQKKIVVNLIEGLL